MMDISVLRGAHLDSELVWLDDDGLGEMTSEEVLTVSAYTITPSEILGVDIHRMRLAVSGNTVTSSGIGRQRVERICRSLRTFSVVRPELHVPLALYAETAREMAAMSIQPPPADRLVSRAASLNIVELIVFSHSYGGLSPNDTLDLLSDTVNTLMELRSPWPSSR